MSPPMTSAIRQGTATRATVTQFCVQAVPRRILDIGLICAAYESLMREDRDISSYGHGTDRAACIPGPQALPSQAPAAALTALSHGCLGFKHALTNPSYKSMEHTESSQCARKQKAGMPVAEAGRTGQACCRTCCSRAAVN
jgi:hypothetical protein